MSAAGILNYPIAPVGLRADGSAQLNVAGRHLDHQAATLPETRAAITRTAAELAITMTKRSAGTPGRGLAPWDNAEPGSPAATDDAGIVSSTPHDRFSALPSQNPEELNATMIDDDHYWDPYPHTLTVAEVQTILRVSRPTAFSRLKSGVIPAHYLVGSWIVFKAELRAWLESTSNQTQHDHAAEVDVLAGYPDELTYQDLMVLFRKSKETIYRWLHTGEIPAYHVTGRWIIRKSHVRQKLEETSNQRV